MYRGVSRVQGRVRSGTCRKPLRDAQCRGVSLFLLDLLTSAPDLIRAMASWGKQAQQRAASKGQKEKRKKAGGVRHKGAEGYDIDVAGF